MRLDRISINHFLSHRNTILDLNGRNLICVIGENGSGKSSGIKDALTWCIWGKARGSGDELIMNGEDDCGIDIDITIGVDAYKIYRTRERSKKTTLSFWKTTDSGHSGESLVGATIAETQEKINKLLGMDYETFVNSSCLEQGRANSFTSLTPKEAKTLLMKILQLDAYEIYKERTKAKSLTLSAQLYVVDSELGSIETQLKSRLDDNLKEWEYKREVDLTESRIEKGVDARAFFMKEQDRLNETYRRLSSERGELTGQFTSLSNQITKTSAKIKVIEENALQCPLCKSSLTEDAHAKILQEFNDMQERDTKKRVTLMQELDGIEREMTKVWNERMKLDSAVNLLQVELETLSQKAMTLREQFGATKARAQVVDDLTGRKDVLIEQKKTLEIEVYRYQTLEKAFSYNGIPALIVDNVLPEIEQSANDILYQLSDGRFRVELSTQRELKTGGTTETLEIKIKSLTNQQSYGTIDSEKVYKVLSGGEAYRVDLSLRIALSRLLARRNNFRVSTLIIDEGLGSLDAEGRDRFVRLMETLKGEFERIIVITHTDSADSFRNVLRVTKEKGESKIQWQM